MTVHFILGIYCKPLFIKDFFISKTHYSRYFLSDIKQPKRATSETAIHSGW